ncbi:MAG: alpha/beta fold hydrolase [Solirubrobacteraceae bacterium]
MAGYRAPGTPSLYDKVGVIKVGRHSARNVLVLEPGTSLAAAYFVPFARWLVSALPNWQVWAVQRRENLLEDQSELNLAKEGEVGPTGPFNYYLGHHADPRIEHHYVPVPDSSVEFAKNWGMEVAVADLRRVIKAARGMGGKVVLGGHSLGGEIVTAYATWDFGGRSGAAGLAGLVYDDGRSYPAISAQQAEAELGALDEPSATPWLAFGGIAAPYAGLFNTVGAMSVLTHPNGPSLEQNFPPLPSDLKPSRPVTNEAQYGYMLNAATSPPSSLDAQAHLGKGISPHTINGYHTWDGDDALTPITRYAAMFAGRGILSANGTEWYYPRRLTVDAGAVNNGIANPAQKVLDVDSTMGRRLPRSLRIYAICTADGTERVLNEARALAANSHISAGNLVLVNREGTYSHNDPAGAYPHNAFFSTLVPFLRRIAR